MLVLMRKTSEEIVVRLSEDILHRLRTHLQGTDDEDILINLERLVKIVVVETRGDKVRLGVDAPREFDVHRMEVWEEIQRKNASNS